ncbi:MAG: peptide ABC transporter permease [Firmicutes bacterium ZCTH02-B6]|nr:MAG: peptide ABC transporter permease [Firmicutes bacterium ZCTH02-B6]
MSRGYLWRRVVYGLITLFVIMTLNFVIFRIMPGDPVSLIISPQFTPEMKQLLIERYGLDKPLLSQYFLYLQSMLTFDFGRSFVTRQPVLGELLSRLPNTLMLLGTSFLLNVFIGVWLGIKMATRQGSRMDTAITGVSLFFNAMPAFFIGLLLLLAFGYYWPIFPIRGTMSVPPPTEFWAIILDRIHHLVMPVTAVTLSGYGSWYLYVRNNMVSALGQDFVLTARAKGLPQREVLYRHAFRNVLPPIVTLVFLSLPGLITGAVITETIFSLYGVGRYLVDATLQQDYPVVQGCFYIIALAVLVCNLLADLVYGLVDPRIRLR